MKNTVCHRILISALALLASVACMAQEAYVLDASAIYIAPNTIVTGLKAAGTQDIVYISKNTSLVVAENSIFTGKIENIRLKISKSVTIAAKQPLVIKTQIRSKEVNKTLQLTALPFSKGNTDAKIIIAYCGASSTPTTHKFSAACSFSYQNDLAKVEQSNKTQQKVFSHTGTKTLQVFENSMLFARPPTA